MSVDVSYHEKYAQSQYSPTLVYGAEFISW